MKKINLGLFPTQKEKIDALALGIKDYRKGTYVPVTFKSECDVKGHKLMKITEGTYRLGCDYVAVAHITNQQPARPAKFRSIVDGYVKETLSNGNMLLTLYTQQNGNIRSHSRYYVDGVEDETLYKSLKPSRPLTQPLIMLTVKLENVLVIG